MDAARRVALSDIHVLPRPRGRSAARSSRFGLLPDLPVHDEHFERERWSAEQLGPADLGRFVGSLDPARLAGPVLMAGQVLEHMTAASAPTRAEVCALHDALALGYAGFVLSDETAIGHDPAETCQAAAMFREAAN